MPEMSNRDWVTHGLDLLARGLKPFVDRHMRSVGDGEHWAEEFKSELDKKDKRTVKQYSIDDPSFSCRCSASAGNGSSLTDSTMCTARSSPLGQKTT